MWPWLAVATRNAALNHVRKHERVSCVEHVDLDALREEAGAPEQPLQVTDEDLRRRVRALPEAQRAVVELRYGEDLSYADIAVRLGLRDAGSARLLRHRALDKLRRRFVRHIADRHDLARMHALAWPVRLARPSGFTPLTHTR